MKSFFGLLLTVLVALPAGALAGVYCATEAPEDVLTCLSQAYENRDLDLYDTLFTEDFVFQYLLEDPHTWGFAEERESAQNLFGSENIHWIRLDIDSFRVAEGDEPETWRLFDVSIVLTVEAEGRDGKPVEMTSRASGNGAQQFFVRQVHEPEPHFRIFRWIDPSAE